MRGVFAKLMNYPRWAQDLSRADFLKSVGLYMTPNRLYLVRLRKDLWRVSVVSQETRELPLAESPSQRRQALGEALRTLLPHFNPSRDPLYLCLSPHLTLSAEIFLPQVAGEDLSQVVEYQIERQIPYRREDVYYGLLPAQKKGEKVSVFLYAVPRSSLDEILDILAGLGITPRGVETTATAVPNCLVFAAGEINGRVVVLGGQEATWELVGLEGGGNGWGHKPRILFTHWLPRADWIGGPGKEILRGGLAGSPRLYTWGQVMDFFPSAQTESPEGRDLLSLASERFGAGGELSHPGFVPAVGTALHGVREATFVTNLLPGSDRSEAGRFLSRLNASLGLLLVLALVGWAGSYPLRDEIRLRQLQKRNQEIAPAVDVLRREEDELNQVRNERRLLSELSANRGEILKILDELSRAVPASAYLSSLRYRGDGVELQGSAESASNLIPILERSPLFENVKFTAPSNRGRDNRETFSLRADRERPKPRAGSPRTP